MVDWETPVPAQHLHPDTIGHPNQQGCQLPKSANALEVLGLGVCSIQVPYGDGHTNYEDGQVQEVLHPR